MARMKAPDYCPCGFKIKDFPDKEEVWKTHSSWCWDARALLGLFE